MRGSSGREGGGDLPTVRAGRSPDNGRRLGAASQPSRRGSQRWQAVRAESARDGLHLHHRPSPRGGSSVLAGSTITPPSADRCIACHAARRTGCRPDREVAVTIVFTFGSNGGTSTAL